MLSSFLSQLQGYFSKYFVLGAFFPLLSWAVINGLIAYVVFPDCQGWIDKNILNASLTSGTFVTGALVVAVTLCAYVMYGLVTAMRQILEGRRWGALGRLFARGHILRLDRMRARAIKASNEIADFDEAPSWRRQLDIAREEGKRLRRGVPFVRPHPDRVDNDLKPLERAMRGFQPISAEPLRLLVSPVAAQLSDADFNAAGGGLLLNRIQRLKGLIDYASQRAPAEYARLKNELNANFGAQDVAPTTMGNVANTIQSYALRRYGCNLDLVWSNLLRVAQNDEKMQGTLLDAKTLLDFLVVCCWLTLLSSIGWTVIFLSVAPSRLGFLAASAGGPIVVWLWYRAATEQYRAFADVAMTTFDMLRFDLLKALRIGAPADVEDERRVWGDLTSATADESPMNFRFETPKS